MFLLRVYCFLAILLACRVGLFWLSAGRAGEPPLEQPWAVTALVEAVAPLRGRILATYRQILPPVQADLLSGVVLGGREMNRDLREKLVNAGLIHVAAASGMNISLFSGMALAAVGILRVGRIQKFVVMVGFILFYTALTEFAPPAERAALMGIAAGVGNLLGRGRQRISGLLIAVFVMLWVSPFLITSPSFLLSVLAMAGQIFLGGKEGRVPEWQGFIIENLRQTLAALLFTLPVVLIFFSRFSLATLPANLLILWTIEPLMILGGLAAAAGFFSLGLAEVILLPARGLLVYFSTVAGWLGRPSFSVSLPIEPLFFAAGYYLLLGAFFLRLKRARQCDV